MKHLHLQEQIQTLVLIIEKTYWCFLRDKDSERVYNIQKGSGEPERFEGILGMLVEVICLWKQTFWISAQLVFRLRMEILVDFHITLLIRQPPSSSINLKNYAVWIFWQNCINLYCKDIMIHIILSNFLAFAAFISCLARKSWNILYYFHSTFFTFLHSINTLKVMKNL